MITASSCECTPRGTATPYPGRSAPTLTETTWVILEETGTNDTDVSWSAIWADETTTIESRFKQILDDQKCQHLDHLDDIDMTEQVKRACMNACMLLSNAGYHANYQNPVWAAKLRSSLGKRKLPESARRANEKALREMPQVVTFSQATRVYRTEPGAARTSDGTAGTTVKAHWRCGHWAHQPCGEGRKDRKLIYREAVLVNADQLTGPANQTVAVYS